MSAYLPAKRRLLALPTRSAARRAALLLLAAAVSGASMTVLTGGWPVRSQDAPVFLPPATEAAQTAVLVRSTTSARRHGFITVVGEVENTSRAPVRNLEAVVEFVGQDGGLLAVESALVEMPLIRPGERSAFSVVARDPSGVDGYRLRFRTLHGAVLSSAHRP